MDAEALQAIGTIFALIIIGAYNGWRTKKAERAAEQAARQTVQTGNGFAGDVIARLDRIAEDLSETRLFAHKTHDLMTDHLSDHARSDLTKRQP